MQVEGTPYIPPHHIVKSSSQTRFRSGLHPASFIDIPVNLHRHAYITADVYVHVYIYIYTFVYTY